MKIEFPQSPAVTEFDNRQAFSEGWGIFDCDGSENGPWQLQRLDEETPFPSDDEAWQYVVERAAASSPYHQCALAYLREHNRLEFYCIAKMHPDILGHQPARETNR
jgi:hypothetical protein